MDEQAIRVALDVGERMGARYALLPPRRTVAGPGGEQLAHRAGSSVEFMEHRDYRAGDDIRRIDWAAYARTDRLTVKQYRDEVSPHVDVVIDGSRSMALPDSAKGEATVGVAAAVASAAASSRFTHHAWLAGEAVLPVGQGRDRPTAWMGLGFDGERSVGEQLAAAPVRFRPHALRVLVSDLLWPDEPTVVLHRLADGAAGVVVVQVLAAADVEPPGHGNLRLLDAETGQHREMFIDDTARQRYVRRLERHQSQWAAACRGVGAVLVTLVAERLVQRWDLSELVREQVLRVL
ncbi:DUF58 domain-containing protein [Phycisphaerales bacterium AB-hyl4]|uniref:DUF58 domain-containing protein n=1 Tax=Natronomicrosphaera hydrolytica TaxID=3242702 RepID=A0ABV4U7V9_9BACT